MTARIKIIIFALLLGAAVSDRLAADERYDFRRRLENAECVIIALMPRDAHAFPKVLAFFGHPNDEMITQWRHEVRFPWAMAKPGQPVLYISAYNKVLIPSGTIFVRGLSGKALEISAETNDPPLTIPFSGLVEYIRAIHNPLLEESFVAKDWTKSIPERAPVFSDDELRAMIEREKAEMDKEKPDPFFR